MFEYLRRRSGQPTDLLHIIADVRARWRMKLALRGAVSVAGIAFTLFLLAAYGMDWARFNPASVLASRVALLVSLVGAVFVFLVRPLRRRVTDEQVALYLEEHEPSLQAMLVSAVEAGRGGSGVESEALVRKVIEQAIAACAETDAVRLVERVPLQRYGLALGGLAAVVLLAGLVGPAFIRNAMSAMILFSSDVEAAAPYRITVTPGDATIPKGSDQTVSATLLGFGAEDVVLMAKRSTTGAFEPLPMVRKEDGTYEGLVFDIAAPLEYVVEAEGVRSPVYTFKVVEVPYVQRLELEYRYPAYTGLEAEKIEDGGDVAVLRGTEVALRIFSTMKTGGGRLALNDKDSIPLTLQPDGSLTAAFKADADGFYHVELEVPTGERVTASPQYTIDVLDDKAPTVTFKRPGRDTSASAVEEVFVEANADDDFGVRNLELVYSVNGGEEKALKLFSGDRRLAEVSAGHTFYLEEMGVKVGDSVSYYARAMDNDAVGGAKTASSDLYFVRIRPFSKDFRQAQSQGGGGGGGGGGGNQVGALSEQQRQIISATFNVQRDRKKLSAEKLRESSTVVSLSQSRLREQVEGMLTRMNSELVERDPAFAKIAELLPQAAAAMKDAEAKLAAASPDTALPPENKALQILQTAEEEFETQISANRQQGGGGGGGGGAMQQELSELFEQDLEQIAGRYETANQSSEQAGDREVDELLEKLKELARRQEQEAERQRRRAIEGQQASGGSSGAQQRALAEQVEEAARRLERLAREEQRPELTEAARQMREAADAMRRAAAGGDANASAQAQAALERLKETERRLQQSLTDRADRNIENAKREADEIAREQQQIAEAANQLPAAGAARTQQARQINERKTQLDTKIGDLESQLDRAALDASKEERAASRKMSEAAGAIRDNRLRDKVRYSQALVSRGTNPQALTAYENDIASGIEDVRKRLDEAAAAVGQGSPDDRREQAVDRARRLARNLGSLQERTRERAERQRNGQQGRDGQDGQQGQGQQQARNGQQGQQGQNGQQGQQGQRGQQGQQGQGQQGQQGQGQGQGQGEGQDGQDGQGQQGQQAGNGQGGGGQRGGDGLRDGSFTGNNGYDRGGAWNGGGTWGGWWDGARLTAEDIRQLRGEVRQYSNEARDLRGLLRAENIDPRELDEIVRALRQLEDDRVYQNVEELARLQSVVAEGLKRFEFGLRRQVEGASAIALSGSDEVPEEYRKLVEQYYRSLAKTAR